MSPIGTKNRRSWTFDGVDAAKTVFAEHLTLTEIPSLPEHVIAIEKYYILQDRSLVQLKAWAVRSENQIPHIRGIVLLVSSNDQIILVRSSLITLK